MSTDCDFQTELRGNGEKCRCPATSIGVDSWPSCSNQDRRGYYHRVETISIRLDRSDCDPLLVIGGLWGIEILSKKKEGDSGPFKSVRSAPLSAMSG